MLEEQLDSRFVIGPSGCPSTACCKDQQLLESQPWPRNLQRRAFAFQGKGSLTGEERRFSNRILKWFYTEQCS